MRVGQSPYPQQTTTDYLDPQSHQNLNRVTQKPDGGYSVKDYNGRRNVGSLHEYDASRKPLQSTVSIPAKAGAARLPRSSSIPTAVARCPSWGRTR
ncbi:MULTISPECIES: hypothetical protein [unclassified Caballeronia]|uniref:hypothetical protein n=1 Tax=unclassified Caballeronia TaxID=2646786 RepID=UPI0028613849|nr:MULTISPECIES: hypothetical protein [unclassified Caballeronia]MDR5816811.1 hypothetical protein [Caballeronia sp. LZ033]MDR5823721.1 hypothetical protein [Caballeronia sp. LZ043]